MRGFYNTEMTMPRKRKKAAEYQQQKIVCHHFLVSPVGIQLNSPTLLRGMTEFSVLLAKYAVTQDQLQIKSPAYNCSMNFQKRCSILKAMLPWIFGFLFFRVFFFLQNLFSVIFFVNSLQTTQCVRRHFAITEFNTIKIDSSMILSQLNLA